MQGTIFIIAYAKYKSVMNSVNIVLLIVRIKPSDLSHGPLCLLVQVLDSQTGN